MIGVSVTPWWESLKLRAEVLNSAGQIDDVQMSLFRAVYGTGALRPLYAEAAYYGDITYPTERLADLLAEVAIRLGGGQDYSKAQALRRLDQGMGGGKSHACIGAFHLGHNPTALAATDLGKAVFAKARSILGRDLPADLGRPQVVVLPCDNMTPGAPVQEHDGPAITLYERFLWRLFSRDYALFERYQPFFNDKSKIVEALRAVNRPVLIVIDEIMDYCGNGLDGARNPNLAAQDMAFLRALFDVTNDVPNVATLVVMIGSDTMALGTGAARERRVDLHSLLERNGTPATVTANADFAEILRRRLFDRPPVTEVVTATARAFARVLADKAWTRSVWDALNANWIKEFEAEVTRTYPFHPMLIALAEQEWAQVTGFQRVRSTIRIFAATVYALQRRGQSGQWVPLLIGPGDLPLSDNTVREAILGSGLVGDDRTIANFRALAENEIVNQDDTGGAAHRLDLTRSPLTWTEANPRAAERGATVIFLTSIVGARPGGRRGASAPEVKAATSVPDRNYILADADGVVEDLVNQEIGMSAVEVIPGQGNNKPARYYLSTKLTYRMLVNNLRKTITDTERDQVLTEFAERLSNSGPFRKRLFIRADLARTPSQVLATAGVDDARTTRLVILDPAQFSLRNGTERDTLVALTAAVGLGTGHDRMPVEWASSAVYAVANTQRRSLARTLVTEYLARQRALATPEVQLDADLSATGNRELSDATEKLEKAVKRAYQHIAYLAQPDPDAERFLDQITFEDDNQTALDGTQVWKALVDREKVFDAGQFSGRGLVHNLRPTDYQRPLSEIRDAFWSAPRLPLLYSGERDLQHAIYEAVQSGELRITDGFGNPVAVTDPGQVNLASTGLRLASPGKTEDGEPSTDFVTEGSPVGTYPTDTQPGSRIIRDPATGEEVTTEPLAAEKYVTFPLIGNLLSDPSRAEDLAQVFRTLYSILDDNKVSYAQGTLQFVMDAQSAERLADFVRSLGVNVTIRDQ
jgi:Protein of unknown function (DUF499)